MSLLSRSTRGGRRVAATAAASTLTLLTWLVIAAVPAQAATTCSAAFVDVEPGAGVVNELTATIAADDSVAFRRVGGAIQKIDNPPADRTTWAALFGACGPAAAPDVFRIQGTNLGHETVYFLNNGGGSDVHAFGAGALVTFVDLDANPTAQPDIVEFLSLGGLTLSVEFGTSTAGNTVVTADWIAELVGNDQADVRIIDTESLVANGDQAPTGIADTLLAGGDMVESRVDITPVGTGTEDIVVPGTPDGGTGVPPAVVGQDIAGSDHSGNLDPSISLLGGPGDDILEPGDGNDIVNGQAGVDSAIYADAGAAVQVDLELGTALGGSGTDTLTDMQNVSGSRFGDELLGSAINNGLAGCNGDDVISGLALNDTLLGDSQLGLLPAGLSSCVTPGDDTLTGGTGNDTVSGEGGDDLVIEDAAANGADVLSGGTGGEFTPVTDIGDVLDHSARTVAVNVSADGVANDGEAGELDNVAADFENYLGGAGADTYSGGAHDETFTPGAGDDTVDGNGDTVGGADYLDLSDAAGPAVFDLITGTATGNGTDTFSDIEGFVGTAADDIVIFDDLGFPVDFDFFGLGGIDTVDGQATALGFTVDLSLLGSGIDVEDVWGGTGADTITGNGVANHLFGCGNTVNVCTEDGFDTISGAAANDFIEGGLGNDVLTGGLGGDTLSYARATGGMLVDAQLGFTEGPDGEDSIGFFEIFLGSNFDDEIIGGQTDADANIRIKGRKGDDNLVGTNSSDTINGAGGNDVIRAGGGDDIAKGGQGNDLVQGSNGDDQLKGGKGNDTGVGGKGFDSCGGFEHERSCEA